MKQKPLGEHSDREIMEKMLFYTKRTSDGTEFIKNFIVVSIVIGLLLMMLGWLRIL